MASCRSLALLLLAATPALAQTTPARPAPATATPAASPATTPASTPVAPTAAPTPDPLMSPDLQRLTTSRPTLASLVAQPVWQEPVIAAARQQFRQLPDDCAAAVLKPSGVLTVFGPAQFDARGTLTSGIWSERVDVTGCGAPRRLNVLTILQNGSAPTRVPTLPGDTHADPATQKSALEYAQAVAIRAAPPSCKQEIFVNTQFDGFTGLPDPTIRDGRDTRAWRENWQLFACGASYIIEMTFKPNAQGMQLTATNPIKKP